MSKSNIKIENLGNSNYLVTNLETGKKIDCYKKTISYTKNHQHKTSTIWSTDGFDSYATRKELIEALLK